jgi:hypothetical protein
VAAALFAASALAVSAARADGRSWRTQTEPGALAALLGSSWASLEVGAAVCAPAAFPGTESAPRLAIAGATLRDPGGWSASLFVTRALADPAGEPVRLADSTAVNARLARRVAPHTTLMLDVFNVLDRRVDGLDAFVAASRWSAGGMPEDYLVHPGEARGIRLGIRRTFR